MIYIGSTTDVGLVWFKAWKKIVWLGWTLGAAALGADGLGSSDTAQPSSVQKTARTVSYLIKLPEQSCQNSNAETKLCVKCQIEVTAAQNADELSLDSDGQSDAVSSSFVDPAGQRNEASAA